MFEDLEWAVNDSNEKARDLERIITDLVKQLYRLQGKVYYEPLSPELEEVKKGEG